MYRALCARSEKQIAGGSAPAPWVAFLCLPKEKRRKERAPPGLRPPTPRVPSRLAGLRGYAHGASLRRVRTRGILAAPLRAYASAALGARLDQGVFKTQLTGCVGVTDRKVFSGPRSARRVPPPHREQSSEPVFEPEARILRPASWRAPGGARNGGHRRSRRALRGVISFGDFSLDKQRKVTCRGSATHKYTRPQAARHYYFEHLV